MGHVGRFGLTGLSPRCMTLSKCKHSKCVAGIIIDKHNINWNQMEGNLTPIIITLTFHRCRKTHHKMFALKLRSLRSSLPEEISLQFLACGRWRLDCRVYTGQRPLCYPFEERRTTWNGVNLHIIQFFDRFNLQIPCILKVTAPHLCLSTAIK